MTESIVRATPPPTREAPGAIAPPLPEDRFINREGSWLDFNTRVLELAEDAEKPLLERVKFAAIFASNLDEFFMVRVAALKRRQVTGLTLRSPDGLTTREQLALIADRARELQRRHTTVFGDQLLPELATAGITLTNWETLPDKEKHRLHGYFREQVFPVLTPLAVDAAPPFA
jgi:polyphosphate kinase